MLFLVDTQYFGEYKSGCFSLSSKGYFFAVGGIINEAKII